MTEIPRRRTSKWDMLADPQIPNEEAETSIKADNGGVPDLDWNSSKVYANTSSLPSELKSDSSKTNNEDYEEDKLTGWLHREDCNVGLANTRSPSPHFPKLPDMDADDGNYTKNSYRESLSVNYTTEKDRDFNRTGDIWDQSLEQDHRKSLSPSHDAKREDDNVRLSNTRSPSPRFPKIPDIYAGDGDYMKHSYREPSSVNRTTAKDDDFNRTGDRWNESLEENRHESLSPSRDAKRKRSPISPKRSWGRSYRSRSRSRSRSRKRSRSRSWSRSRSPSYGYRRGPGRSRSRSRSPYGSRRGPERWSGRGGMGSGPPVPCRDFAAGRCQRGSDCRFLHEDSSRRQPNRNYDSGISDSRESRAERGRINAREPQNYPRDRFSRSDSRTTRCYDFMMGRCRRGSECRYAHHEASHDRERDVRDEPRAQTHDRRDDERRDPPRRPVTDTPCKFFAEGCCRRGEGCRFSHHGVGVHDDSSSYSKDIDVRNSSRNSRNQGDQSAVIEITKSSKWMGNDNGSKVEDSMLKPQHSQPQVPESNIRQNQPQKASNPLHVASVPVQNFGQVGQNQHSSGQPTHAQGFIPNVPFQQLLPPMPLNVQMQQAAFSMPQNGQGGLFIVPQAPSNFSVPMQNLPVLPPSNITMGQQNYNLPLPPHTGQNQQNFNLTGQIQQNPPLAPLSGQNQLNLNFSGQNQNVASQSLHLENFNSNEQLLKRADASEQPSQLNSDASITQKVVTSEQAAQITNLSASLAHFFGGTGGLNSQISTGVLPLVQPNQGSFTNPTSGNMEPVNQDTKNLPAGVVQKGHAVEEAVTNTNSIIPPIKSVDVEIEVMQGIVDTAAKEVNETEAVHNKKERVEDMEAEVQKDGESKQSKDAKGMRMFKCALVEFVKEVLKPSWKEGHLSKEAHKTIVKKAVEKVTGAMQSQNIPQTQEKIDIYLAHSKAKLTKLVQAYVDKYVKG